MQTAFDSLFGNEALKKTMTAKICSDTAAHAYLLEGPEGSGRKTAARLLAAALCCESRTTVPCGTCPACRKILAGLSPDVISIGDAADQKTKSIGIETVRLLRQDVYIRPNDLERKIYLISRADSMTVQAQNALLKILEEPPETVIFFLMCESRQGLLPTIRSRVQTLAMERFPDDVLYGLLLRHEKSAAALQKKDDARLRLFVRLADGAYGKALFYLGAQKKQLSEDPVYASHKTAEACLVCVFADADETGTPLLGETQKPSQTALYQTIAAGGDTREKLRFLLDALNEAVRDLTLSTAAASVPLLFYPQAEQPAALAARCDRAALYALYRKLALLRSDLDSNPNVTLVQSEAAAALYSLRS